MTKTEERRSLENEIGWAIMRVLLKQHMQQRPGDVLTAGPVSQKLTQLTLVELGWRVVPSADDPMFKRFTQEREYTTQRVLQNLGNDFAAKAME